MPKTLLTFTHLAEGKTSGGECEYEMKLALLLTVLHSAKRGCPDVPRVVVVIGDRWAKTEHSRFLCSRIAALADIADIGMSNPGHQRGAGSLIVGALDYAVAHGFEWMIHCADDCWNPRPNFAGLMVDIAEAAGADYLAANWGKHGVSTRIFAVRVKAVHGVFVMPRSGTVRYLEGIMYRALVARQSKWLEIDPHAEGMLGWQHLEHSSTSPSTAISKLTTLRLPSV